MQATLFVVLTVVVPAYLMVRVGFRYHKAADQHRTADAPERTLYSDERDLFRPRYYTDEGNRIRERALFFTYGAPLLWVILVLLTAVAFL